MSARRSTYRLRIAAVHLVNVMGATIDFRESGRRIPACVGEQPVAFVARQVGKVFRIVAARAHEFLDERLLQTTLRSFRRGAG